MLPEAEAAASIDPPETSRPHAARGDWFFGDDYCALPRDPETWLIKPLVPAGGACLIYGDAKVGKSYAALQLAMALSGDATDWFDFPICTTGFVLYLQLDTPRSLWAQRLEDLRAASFTGVNGVVMADRDTLQSWPFDITNPLHARHLRAICDEVAPIAVIVDTIREAHTLNENESDAMQRVISSLNAAIRPAALILIAHARKPAVGPDGHAASDLMADNRGSSYVVGRMDAIVRFTKSSLYYAGRATEPGHVKLNRLDCGLWTVARDDTFGDAVKVVMADSSLTSVRERARALSVKTGRGEESCRNYLRKFVPKHEKA